MNLLKQIKFNLFRRAPGRSGAEGGSQTQAGGSEQNHVTQPRGPALVGGRAEGGSLTPAGSSMVDCTIIPCGATPTGSSAKADDPACGGNGSVSGGLSPSSECSQGGQPAMATGDILPSGESSAAGREEPMPRGCCCTGLECPVPVQPSCCTRPEHPAPLCWSMQHLLQAAVLGHGTPHHPRPPYWAIASMPCHHAMWPLEPPPHPLRWS